MQLAAPREVKEATIQTEDTSMEEIGIQSKLGELTSLQELANKMEVELQRNEVSSKEANEKILRMEGQMKYLSHVTEITKLRVEGTQAYESKGEVKALSEKWYILNEVEGVKSLLIQAMGLAAQIAQWREHP
eukprot:Gb_39239 [translate_table: standard]